MKKQAEKAEIKLTDKAMHKRRETMADGRRYIIYYTFDGAAVETEISYRHHFETATTR